MDRNPFMNEILGLLNYVFFFILLYFQVFIVITLIENWGFKERINEDIFGDDDSLLPEVTIIVPVWNEEKTVVKTVESLLSLDYPKEKLFIMVVDDGSTDSTWECIQVYKDNPGIILHKKENGGKYTALNYAIERATTPYIGCLDADSFVNANALRHIISCFTDDSIVAVTPAMKIYNASGVLSLMQNAEYNLGIAMQKIFSMLGAQYVTPGPFSFFRHSVFSEVGPYKHAHNTEDLEMALRIQSKGSMRIRSCPDAIVFTSGPRTLYKLYKQRIRWTTGFLNNALDYRQIFFNRKYENLGVFVLPFAVVGFIFVIFSLVVALSSLFKTIRDTIITITTIGFQFSPPDFLSREWWLYHIQAMSVVQMFGVAVLIFLIWYGKRIARTSESKFIDIIFFLTLYSIISPLWIVKSLYLFASRRTTSWR